ncbi:MAG: DNA-3-methyladenine glycosylase I [Euzebyales bacterium]|nr:DNA-3-methyladenine glycosylase I [Euzebyales bacterium]MBA3622006.1 DNA-3-methyladenine glycosylase I [Euzebyales bacterium]
MTRCWWAGSDPAYVAYHDDEWGRPVTDDRALFEKLCLESFQAGLSWLTILRKRAAFRAGFAGFDVERVAAFGDADVERLMADPGVIRNRAKILATIANARTVQGLGRPLSQLVWSFAPPPAPAPSSPADVAAVTAASTALSRELKRAGFRFVGPTTVHAFMQAMGLVNDHLAGCPSRDLCTAEQDAARRRLGLPPDESAA